MKINEKKVKKILSSVKNKHHFIPEYAENYTLIQTGNKNDFNNYDFKLEDLEGNQLILRKTLHGDASADVLFILKTSKGKFINETRRFNQKDIPVKVYCMKSEKEWKFSFKGNVINTLTKDKTHLEFNAVFSSDEPLVDIFDQINPQTTAQKLKDSQTDQRILNLQGIADQVSYEQKGVICAEIKFKEETISLSSEGIRKHKFGQLELQNFISFLNRA